MEEKVIPAIIRISDVYDESPGSKEESDYY